MEGIFADSLGYYSVWEAIEVGHHGRDKSARSRGYTANSYLETLEEGLILIYETGNMFQQDNVAIHRAPVMQDFPEDHGIWSLDWSPYSSDLNTIENV